MLESLTQSFGRVLDRFRGPGRLDEASVKEGMREVRRSLLEADVHFGVARDFCKRVGEQLVGSDEIAGVQGSQQTIHAFHEELVRLMEPGQGSLPTNPGHPMVLLLAGLQGAGKTTTAAKLGLWLTERKNKKVLLVAADLQRPAAVDQLETLGRSLNLAVHAEPLDGESKPTPPQVVGRAIERARKERFDVVILDSAGRLHVDDELMEEIASVEAVAKPDASYLVLDAMTGQDAVESAKSFASRLSLYGVILTKVDGDARGGAALSVREVTGRPLAFLGVGEKPSDLEEFDPGRLAGRILGMGDVVGLVEKAQVAVDEQQAAADYTKMLSGEFSLEDLLSQFRMLRRMGPLKKVFGMLPGAGKMSDLLDQLDDRQFARMEAIVLSMTPAERLHPEIVDGRRRLRIARGSGNQVSEVNRLLQSFRGMKKQMKAMGRKFGGGKGTKRLLRQLKSSGRLPFPPQP